MRRGGQTYHYIFDGRGSVVGLTDSAGNLVNTYAYEPYGGRHHAAEAVPNPFQHNAGYTIDGTLYKHGTRYYDTSTANWTQPDPLPNQPRYAYAGSDPINKHDPTSLAGTYCPLGALDSGTCIMSPSSFIELNRRTDPDNISDARPIDDFFEDLTGCETLLYGFLVFGGYLGWGVNSLSEAYSLAKPYVDRAVLWHRTQNSG